MQGPHWALSVRESSWGCRFIPGASSSGSASLVGRGLVSFALGSDTAGSGDQSLQGSC